MRVSVIIPVYNAKRFLAEAIESVLIQPEVSEILLVEDGSHDGSIEICRTFQDRYPGRVRLLQHPAAENRGAGETRNLGMLNASSEFIAFLDADDLYLPNRFVKTETLFLSSSEADGVYETVGTVREEHGLSEVIIRRAGAEQARIEPTTPSQLFRTLAMAKSGYIHLNGVTIRRSSMDASIMFDPELRQCQDTDFLLRWSASKKLFGVDPAREVALRRVHDQNRVFNMDEALHFRYLCMRKCALHQFYGSKDRAANWQILNRMARATTMVRKAKQLHLPISPFRLSIIVVFLISRPRVIAGLFGK